MSILDTIADYARIRVEKDLESVSREQMKKLAENNKLEGFPFEKALKKPGLTFICECKKASPSKGIIAEDFDCLAIAKAYKEAGADALSILSEPKWFLGKDEYISQVSKQVDLPILRKDFVVDEYMIDQARVLGASAVLLIASILSDEQLIQYIKRAHELGLSAVCEAHDEEEINRLDKAGARIIGVNNRNLKDFSVSMNNAASLKHSVPKDILFISESGVKNRKDIEEIEAMEADGVLIGEALMRAENKKEKLNSLKGIL